MVLSETVKIPWLSMPPPRLPVTVQSVTVSVPEFSMPPALPPEMVRPEMEAVVEPSTWNTVTALLPLTVSTFAPGP